MVDTSVSHRVAVSCRKEALQQLAAGSKRVSVKWQAEQTGGRSETVLRRINSGKEVCAQETQHEADSARSRLSRLSRLSTKQTQHYKADSADSGISTRVSCVRC
jgi:hypothetical protein